MELKEYIEWCDKHTVEIVMVVDKLIEAMLDCGADHEEARKAATEFWESTH